MDCMGLGITHSLLGAHTEKPVDKERVRIQEAIVLTLPIGRSVQVPRLHASRFYTTI